MDKIGLKELLHEAQEAAAEAWTSESSDPGADLLLDSETILDRLAQMGLLALQHDEKWLWTHVLQSLVTVYRIGLPADTDAIRPPTTAASWLARVTQRVLLLGALAHKMQKYEEVRELVVQRPVNGNESGLWLRYTVTMASRGGVSDVLKGKSLIGPASEAIRQKPHVFTQFESNLDLVVNNMCQFDYLACVISLATTESAFSCYPNFGAYYSHRTLPVVHDLIDEGRSRTAVPGVENGFLAEIIEKLGRLAGRAFFEVSGFDGYDQRVAEFLNRTPHTHRILDVE